MIYTVEETGSTNADLLGQIRRAQTVQGQTVQGHTPAEGTWLQALQQVSGRGRHARAWISPPGNLYCSTPVVLSAQDPPAHTLSFVCALAVYDTLCSSLQADTLIVLKWPNDVLIGKAKIAGILLERMNEFVVAGFGINVCFAPKIKGRETTSIQYENGGGKEDVQAVLHALIAALALRLQQWRNDGVGATLAQWLDKAHPLGTSLSVTEGESSLQGVFAGIDDNGALLLRLADGAIHTVHAADVQLG